MKDKIVIFIITTFTALVITVMGWMANMVYESMQEKMNENRDSIQALIDLHLKK